MSALADMRGADQARRRLALLAVAVILAITVAWARPAHAAGRCPQYESLLAAYDLPVATFSHIMYRESGCKPGVINRRSGTVGLLQVHPVNYRYLRHVLDAPVSTTWLRNPEHNVRAAHALYVWACQHHRRGCMAPWR